jgi:hypothetical protein
MPPADALASSHAGEWWRDDDVNDLLEETK